jgi:hypothetical protein
MIKCFYALQKNDLANDYARRCIKLVEKSEINFHPG